MPLTTGSRFGPYEILAPLGAGGMGEVYRARDTRLGRDVALKVLPQHLAATPELRARFEREARAISSLNHPNICTLFDVGREGDTDYLVMELVEGETLDERLARGPLPMDQVLKLGSEIADALDRAHKSSIVHRDLKPGNVMLTRMGAKLMDFGLARATGLEGPGSGSGLTMAALTQSPTIARPLTAEGTIVGTFQYMSPEQLEGRDADSRSDIWAFGCLLFEMATGKRAFEGRSQASLISAIMERVPNSVSQVVPTAPPALDRLVGQCLAKDPDERWQSAADIRRELQWIGKAGSQAGVAAPVAARRRDRERLAWGLAAALGVVALGLAALVFTRPHPVPQATRFSIAATNGIRSMVWPKISPDGRMIAFLATDTTGKAQIWVRPMNSLNATPIPGTEGANRPFWSPDSRYLAYTVGTQLKKVPATGGPSTLICDSKSGADGTWGAKGMILLDGGLADSIRMVSAEGGELAPATFLDHRSGELYHAWPSFLPDGKHFLFLAFRSSTDSTRIGVGCLGSKDVRYLGTTQTVVAYAAPGYLINGVDGTLMARPFDAGSLKFKGEPFPVAEGVQTNSEMAQYSVSANGCLAFEPNGSGQTSRLVWVDRTGKEIGQAGGKTQFGDLDLSPDGSRVAFDAVDASSRGSDLWVWDARRSVSTKLTFDATANEIWPTWSPDGSQIAYASNASGTYALEVVSSSGTGKPRELFRSTGPSGPTDWARDGRTVFFNNYDSGNPELCAISPDSGAKVVRLLSGKTGFSAAKISPDGKWLLYRSDESGRPEIYVQSFPFSGGKWQISTQGGLLGFWRADGREIIYRNRTNGVEAVPVSTTPTFQAGIPVKLFDRVLNGGGIVRNRFVPSADCQRFLLNVPEEAGVQQTFTVVQDWTAEARRK